jgi:hypothetical protein
MNEDAKGQVELRRSQSSSSGNSKSNSIYSEHSIYTGALSHKDLKHMGVSKQRKKKRNNLLEKFPTLFNIDL